ncbi:MAG TPA: hypothetical protein VL332_08130 [Candidatus Saccharimonadaceae bacterium]|jgi:hypothetical protein|nr:hypothetical protein [Candidatus Saccharimonadaceae bacterium]
MRKATAVALLVALAATCGLRGAGVAAARATSLATPARLVAPRAMHPADDVAIQESPQQLERREERTAVRWALVGTIAPVATGVVVAAVGSDAVGGTLITSGIVLGPAVGFARGGCGGRGALGVLARGGLLTVATAAAIAAAIAGFDSDSNSRPVVAAATIAVLCTAGTVADCVYDITRVDDAVRQRHERSLHASLTPVTPFGPGVALHLTF